MSNEYGVVADALRAEARTWKDAATTAKSISTQVKGMELGNLEAGMFLLLVEKYNAVVRHVEDRCAEGEERMNEIAEMLTKTARAYDDVEAENAAGVQNAGGSN